MVCKFCGKSIDDTGGFCKYCGQSQDKLAEKTNTLSDISWTPGVSVSKKEDFVISLTAPVMENEEETYLPSTESDEKEILVKKLLKLESTPIEPLDDYPFFTTINITSENNSVKETLNIDIDSSFIKLLQMDLDKTNFMYPDFYVLEKTPEGAFKEDFFVNPAPVARLIKQYITDSKLNFNKLRFSIPTYQSMVKTIILRRMDDNKLSDAIKKEISSSMFFPYKNAIIDSYILSRSIPDDEGYMKVLVRAMNRDYVNKLESIANSLEVKFEIISAHKAMFRTLQLLGKKMEDMAVIDISYYNTGITIIKNGMIEQTIAVREGLKDFIKAIATGKEISMTRAKEILINTELDITRSDKKQMGFFHIITPSIRDWITGFLKGIASLGGDYKLNKNNYSYLILCGEGTTIKSFNNYLGNQLGIKCYNLNMPFSEIEDKSNDFFAEKAPLFMTCLGMCVNSFYPEDEEREKIKMKRSPWYPLNKLW